MDEEGGVSVWNRKNLIKLYHYRHIKVLDFNIMPSMTNITQTQTSAVAKSQLSIIALSDIEMSTGLKHIEVILLPQFFVTHHIPVSPCCWLVKTHKGLEVFICFIWYILVAFFL